MTTNQSSWSGFQSQSGSKWLPYLFIALFSCIGGMLLFFVTVWGIGISPDSTVYINVARNLMKGYGFSVSPGTPLTHYPPLYPLFLTLGAIGGQDLLNGARVLHIFLFVATLSCAGLIIYHETRRSIIAAIFGILLLICSKNVILVYAYAWSESLFILLTLAGLFLMIKYLETSRLSFLYGSSVLICFAFLTRYAGISLVLTGLLCILLFSKSGLFRRAVIAGVFSAITLIPISLWLLRNRMAADTLTNRSITTHPVTWQHVNGAIITISGWFLIPQDWSIAFKAGFIVVFAIIILEACILLWNPVSKTTINRPISYFPSIFIIFILSFFLSLGFSISFVDAQIPLSDRILSPLYIAGIIALICIAHYIWLYFDKGKAVTILLSLFFLSFLTAQANHAIPFIASLHDDGSNGYSNKYWKNSSIIKAVKTFPDDLVIFSNGPDAIEMLAGKQSQMIPRKINTDTRFPNENFEPQFKDMLGQIENGRAILIYFSQVGWRWYLPSEQEITGKLPVGILYKSWDGTIWGTAEQKITVPRMGQ